MDVTVTSTSNENPDPLFFATLLATFCREGVWMKFWVNPTGQIVRNDAAGEGTFGAKRGDRAHLGTDFECIPGQGVVATTDMQYRRYVKRVYATDMKYVGMEFESSAFVITMFYVSPSRDHMSFVKAGELVGLAQGISEKYGHPMMDHVHLQVALKPYAAIIKGGQWNTKPIYINPLILIDVGV